MIQNIKQRREVKNTNLSRFSHYKCCVTTWLSQDMYRNLRTEIIILFDLIKIRCTNVTTNDCLIDWLLDWLSCKWYANKIVLYCYYCWYDKNTKILNIGNVLTSHPYFLKKINWKLSSISGKLDRKLWAV